MPMFAAFVPAGVRYLIPFVDHRVLDFAVSIPRQLYLNEKGNRWAGAGIGISHRSAPSGPGPGA